MLTYPYNIFRQGTKRTQPGEGEGGGGGLDKLQIAHIAHPTFAFNFELRVSNIPLLG